MKVLTFNVGSTSIKYSYYDLGKLILSNKFESIKNKEQIKIVINKILYECKD